MKFNLELLLFLITLFFGIGNLQAQSLVLLDDCGVSYIDPQDAAGNTNQSQDTLRYTTSFSTPSILRSFFIDINAFGGQQVDRTTVYAILPDNSKKEIGALSFGNCLDCVDGFALVHNNVLEVESVNDQNLMEMWITSFNQPDFTLTGNLQILTGVGRISGTIPSCATGLEVEYVVFSDPQNTTTEFSTHILCPEEVMDCSIIPELQIDCPNNTFTLNAEIPTACFSQDVNVQWSNASGPVGSGAFVQLDLDGNEGMYYLSVEDDCCSIIDSVTSKWVTKRIV